MYLCVYVPAERHYWKKPLINRAQKEEKTSLSANVCIGYSPLFPLLTASIRSFYPASELPATPRAQGTLGHPGGMSGAHPVSAPWRNSLRLPAMTQNLGLGISTSYSFLGGIYWSGVLGVPNRPPHSKYVPLPLSQWEWAGGARLSLMRKVTLDILEGVAEIREVCPAGVSPIRQ